jgi:sugar lactone lactonase YvrE
MAKVIRATPIVQTENTLGEGPLWHSIHQMLYWVDIEQKIVHAFEPHTKRHREWPVPKRVGTVVPASDGTLVLGLQGEVATLDPATGQVQTLFELEPELHDNRCNDGKCDPAGRFWVGTMQLDTKPKTGSLYCVDQGFRVQQVLTGLTIANGMGWSPAGEYMYFIDSADHNVKRYRFTTDAVALGDEEVVVRFDGELPDGMCVDSEGMLWVGMWGSNRVGCYDPATGRHLVNVEVPAPNVTSCCFGGEDLQTLYITTARQGLTGEQLKQFPLSGSLFSCSPGVRGLSADVFGVRRER